MKYKINKYVIDAESPTKAVKIAKLLDDYPKMQDIYRLCVRNNYYTRGTTNEYDKMLNGVYEGTWSSDEVAADIYEHSNKDWGLYDKIRKEVKAIMKDSIKDAKYSFEELQKIWVAKHPDRDGDMIDIFKIDGKYCMNPNVTRERYNTIEEVKREIEKLGNHKYDSVKDSDYKVGDRVRHLSQETNGTVKKIIGNNIYVEWDEPIYDRNGGSISASEIDPAIVKIKKLSDSLEDASKYLYLIRSYKGSKEIEGRNEEEAVNKYKSIYPNVENEDITIQLIKQYNKSDYTSQLISENRDSVKDDDIDELSDEEKKAIEDYKAAIANTNDPKLLKIFGHILKEEVEHLEELQNEELEDSCKDSRTVKIQELKKGDKFKDPYYNNEECIVESTNVDGDYKIRSITKNESYLVSKNKKVLIDSIK